MSKYVSLDKRSKKRWAVKELQSLSSRQLRSIAENDHNKTRF